MQLLLIFVRLSDFHRTLAALRDIFRTLAAMRATCRPIDIGRAHHFQGAKIEILGAKFVGRPDYGYVNIPGTDGTGFTGIIKCGHFSSLRGQPTAVVRGIGKLSIYPPKVSAMLNSMTAAFLTI